MSFLWLMSLVGIGAIFFVVVYGVYIFYRLKKAQQRHEGTMERVFPEKNILASLPKADNPEDPNLLLGQLDVIEDYNAPKIKIGNFEWHRTTPVNTLIERTDLPSKDASADHIYEIANTKSDLRKQMGSFSLYDGRYCPIDHIVTENQSVHNCPKCGRKLLWFGWD